jgi:sphinganine-1-phosphate aldolase
MAKTLCERLNEVLKDTKPSKIVFVSVSATLAAIAIVQLTKHGRLVRRTGTFLLATARSAIQPIVDKKINEAAKGLRFPNAEGERFFHSIPKTGLSDAEVVGLSDELHAKLDKKMNKSLLSGVVYWGTHNHHKTLMKILDTHLWSNPLFADYFGATRKMEAEIGSMCLDLFHADLATAAASYTMGGTESILVAMLAYTRLGRSRGIQNPEIIVCVSAHPAFDKAEQYFGCRLVKVPFDPDTLVMSVDEAEKSITANTVAVVGSAPSYPYGVVDDLAGLSALAIRRNIGMHVDACVGGFLMQFYRLAGLKEIVIDFRLPGVTSISADIHKWGGAPKGASMALFRTKELRAHHIFAYPDFPGGLYVTSAVSGSKPGYTVACAWATMLLTGKEQYAANARAVVLAANVFANNVSKIPHLRVLGAPDASIVAFTSDTVDIYKVMKKMCDRGYNLNALQFPCAVHLGLTMEHTMPGVMEAMTAALAEITSELAEESRGKGTFVQRHDALIYGSTQGVPDRGIIVEVLKKYVEAYYTNEPNDGVL